MEIASLVVAIIAALISVASAYAAWRATRPKPKLSGSITTTWGVGVTSSVPGVPSGSAVGLHVVLTNASSHPVHPMEFRLEVRTVAGWLPGKRLQNWQATLPELSFDNHVATMTYDHLIDWPPRPVHHGAPLMGFLYYLVPNLADEADVEEYRVTVTDVFGGSVQFTTTAAEVAAWKASDDGLTLLELMTQAGVPVRTV
ncbi:hypothetical protein GCM10010344_00030 [Streptomyces bluensis]|nr:hypothetical protein GCM10010344_00030 [Streptomyces bluensis]